MSNQQPQTYPTERGTVSIIEELQISQKTVISAVIRVRNAAEQLKNCLIRLKQQNLSEGSELEIVVVDNDSRDNSVHIAMSHGAIVTSISTENFSWGKSLNMGISKTKGKYILLLSSDAYPCDNTFIEEMLQPMADIKVAAVYGRQIPYPNVPVDELVRLKKYFISENKRFDRNSKNVLPTGKGMIASNACALIRKSVWEQLEFDEQVEGGEDGIWAYKILQAGYTVAYQAQAKVYHSHKDGAFKLAWRECELLKKNIDFNGRHFNLRKIPKYLISFCVRRLKNCIRPRIPVLLRLKGILRLPWEMTAIAIIGFCMTCTGHTRRIRRLFWQ